MSKVKTGKPSKQYGTSSAKKFISSPSYKSSFDLNKYFEQYGIYILLALILIVSFFVYKDFLFFKNLFIYKDIGSDTYNSFVPTLVHNTNYLRTEGFPKWTFSQGMGQNFYPGGVNEPFNLFLYLFDANHISYAIAYAQVIKIILGGVIFFYYLRTVGATPYSSIIGALLFSFSGYMILGGGWYNHASWVVYGAFLLFSFEKLYKKKSWFYFPVAIAIMSNDIFSLYIYSAFLFLYTLMRFYYENKFKNLSIISLFLKMAGLGLLGIAINAVFMVGPLVQMIESPRVSGEAGYFNALRATPIFNVADPIEIMSAVMRSFSSDLMGTGSNFKGWQNYLEAPIFYSGILSLLLLPQVFQFFNRRQKIILSAFLTFWLLLILFPFMRYSLYLFSGNYYKNGMSFFIPSIFLFTGINALSHIDKLNKINMKVLIITFIVLLILLYYPYFATSQNYIDKGLRGVITFFLIIYFFLIWLLSSKGFKIVAQVAMLLMLCIEVYYFSSITTNKRLILSKNEMEQKTGFNDYTIDAVNYLKTIDKNFYRINKDYFSGTAIHTSLNDAMIQDYYGTPSYQSFNQLNYIKFLSETNVIKGNVESDTRWSRGLIPRPLLQIIGNVKYTLSKQADKNYLKLLNDSIAAFNDVTVFKSKFYLPLGYTYNKYILHKDFKTIATDLQKDKCLFQAVVIDDSLKNSFKNFSQFDLKDTTTDLTFDQLGQFTNNLKKDTLAINEHSQNSIKGKIKLDSQKLLFFSIPYDDGWMATVDGKEIKPLLVNIGFTGLLLDKGEHEVTLQFRPPYVRQSAWLSVAGILIYAGLFAFWKFRKTKKE